MINIKSVVKSHKKKIITASVLLLIGFCYYLLITLTPLSIPCVFNKLTGLACPGCGITHALYKLISLDFIGAIKENLGITALIIIWLVYALIYLIFRFPSMKKNGKTFNAVIWSCVVLLILFAIIRNLPFCSFLLPSYMQ